MIDARLTPSVWCGPYCEIGGGAEGMDSFIPQDSQQWKGNGAHPNPTMSPQLTVSMPFVEFRGSF